MLCMNEFTLFVGGGGVVTFERKEICNFVLFCWTLTNCRIPHLIVLVVLECCWFVQKLGKWGLECVVWYVIVSTLIVGRTYSGGTCGSNSWVGCPARFLLCINELCRVSVVIRLQAGQLRNHYSVPGRGSYIFFFSPKKAKPALGLNQLHIQWALQDLSLGLEAYHLSSV
jgi:hypothetical protein